MIINISKTMKINVRFKGTEFGFGIGETKNVAHLLNDAEEKQLASKFPSLFFMSNKDFIKLRDDKKKKEAEVDVPVAEEKAPKVKTPKSKNVLKPADSLEKKLDEVSPKATESATEPDNDNAKFNKESEYCTKETILLGEMKTEEIIEADVVGTDGDITTIPLDGSEPIVTKKKTKKADKKKKKKTAKKSKK